MTSQQKAQLIQEAQLLEAQIIKSKHIIRAFEETLFDYSQLVNQEVGSMLIVQTTERVVAERQQHQAILVKYEEVLSELGSR